MNEIVIKKVDYLPESDSYVARCIVVTGSIIPKTTWTLKYNHKVKIIFDKQVVTHNKEQEAYLVDFVLSKNDYNIGLFNKPTSWLNK